MVEQDAGSVALPDGVGSVVDVLLLSAPDAQETDDVVLRGLHGIVAQRDARLGGRLSGDSGVLADGEVGFQWDDAADVEDDDFPVVALDGLAQRTGARVIEVGNVDYPSAASAIGVASVSLGSGEGGNLSRCCQCQCGNGY